MTRRCVGKWVAMACAGIGMVSPMMHRASAQEIAVEIDGPRIETRAADELLSRLVSIDVEGVPLTRAIDLAALSAKVPVQYRVQAIEAYRRPVTLHLSRVPLRIALDSMLTGTTLYVVPDGVTRLTIIERKKAASVEGGVSGKVTDAATNHPVSGATVTLEGAKFSTRTTDGGTFRMAGVTPGTYTLVVRRLGYTVARKAITVSENAIVPMDIALSAAATPLDEIVTTVTGPQRRMELGNSIGRISNVDSIVKESPVTTLSQLLTSRVPGMTVSQSQGTVGGEVRLQIRGMTSLNGSSEPIVVVDGIRYQSSIAYDCFGCGEGRSPLNDLNPNDIETIEVVKGPSAATLYGPNASNGVIVITTKKGKAGPPRWAAFGKRMFERIPTSRIEDSYFGWGHNSGGFKFRCDLVAVGRGECEQDSVVRVSSPSTGAFSVLQPAQSWSSGVSVSGGQQAFRYFFAANTDRQIGAVGLPDTVIALLHTLDKSAKIPDELMRPNTQTMLDLRTNINTAIGSKLDLLLNASYTRSNTQNIERAYTPFVVQGTASDTAGLWYASLASAGSQIKEVTNRFTTSINGTATATSWLTARGTIGVDASTPVRTAVFDRPYNWLVAGGGRAADARGQNTIVTAELGATATNAYSEVWFRTSVGGQFVKSAIDMVTVSGDGLPPHATSVQRAAQKSIGSVYSETVTLGGYFEETVSLFDRLFLTGALRGDGASTFGEGINAAVYPKLSASWVVSQEPFMARMPGINDLRFRAAYGLAGRHPSPGAAEPFYGLLDEPIPNVGPGRILTQFDFGNPELRPERGQEFEIGFDAGLLNRRLQLEWTTYRRRTSDQIVNVVWPVGLGGRQENVGLTTEHGNEAQLTATVVDARPVSWTITLQRATRATKLVHLGNVIGLANEEGGFREGYPLGARFNGVIESFADANSDGVIGPDEIVMGDSAVYAGENSTPQTTTVTTNLGLLNNKVRFSAVLDRQSGMSQVNDFFGCGGCRERNDRTTPLALQAAVVARENFFPGKPAYRYIESGGFTRLREVSATVTLPNLLIQHMGASSGSISLSARNLGLWSQFTGADPESGGLPGQLFRSRSYGIPQNRTFLLRCDLGL